MLVIGLEMRRERTLDECGIVVSDFHNTVYPDNLENKNMKTMYKIHYYKNCYKKKDLDMMKCSR